MAVIKWRLKWREIFPRIRDYFGCKYAQLALTARSLTYNEHMSQSYAVDFMLEPIFWFVDNFASYLGRVFVFCVTVLTTAVVAIAYWVGLPYWWQKSPYTTVFLVIFGNWLLLNIIFHYYMGVATSPGYPPHGSMIAEAASICKKCISPKPPRTHHCSVCDRCVLAMDHHCPWLNNCVGYYNARYFYLYMAYMVAGVTFVIFAGIDIGYQVIWVNDTGGIIPHNDPDLVGHPVRMNQSGVLVPVKVIVEYDSINSPREHELPVPPITETQRIAAHPWKRKAVIFMAFTCVSVLFALGTLVIMHGKNVGRGETSVEAHINASLRKTQADSFRNPYDFGRRKNWKLFLGLTQGRTFARHVLLPSRHAPAGSGLTWHTVHDTAEDWP
ncbi:palmitoyltransferase ZDHHC16 [Leguminivora glycinivorella]|uniref:palmitoyltransferase ZDHHC16 n=1 Tax=Leguminivora glycinivorella TaxID=1035111 RepID=UPI0020105267|nr:palmitoyltransferase ZDHHC16 [Leguminivora glycinivorella]